MWSDGEEFFRYYVPKVDIQVKSDFSCLPEDFNIDYMVYSVSSSITEEEEIWQMPFLDVVKRNLFKRFDNWVESRQHERAKK